MVASSRGSAACPKMNSVPSRAACLGEGEAPELHVRPYPHVAPAIPVGLDPSSEDPASGSPSQPRAGSIQRDVPGLHPLPWNRRVKRSTITVSSNHSVTGTQEATKEMLSRTIPGALGKSPKGWKVLVLFPFYGPKHRGTERLKPLTPGSAFTLAV